MKRVAVLSLLFALFLTIGACGGDDEDQSASSGTTKTAENTETTGKTATPNTGKTLPEQQGQTLSPGKYVTDEFQPGFSFQLGEGWKSVGPEIPENVAIEGEGDSPSILGFSNPRQVFDSKKPAEQKEVPAPDTVDGWVAWYQQNPYLDVSDPKPVSISSATGVSLSTRVTSTPENYPQDCVDPCVPGFPLGNSAADFYLGDSYKTFVVEAGGETVIVSVAAPAEEFEKFLSKAQEVLDTVEWKATS